MELNLVWLTVKVSESQRHTSTQKILEYPPGEFNPTPRACERNLCLAIPSQRRQFSVVGGRMGSSVLCLEVCCTEHEVLKLFGTGNLKKFSGKDKTII